MPRMFTTLHTASYKDNLQNGLMLLHFFPPKTWEGPSFHFWHDTSLWTSSQNVCDESSREAQGRDTFWAWWSSVGWNPVTFWPSASCKSTQKKKGKRGVTHTNTHQSYEQLRMCQHLSTSSYLTWNYLTRQRKNIRWTADLLRKLAQPHR